MAKIEWKSKEQLVQERMNRPLGNVEQLGQIATEQEIEAMEQGQKITDLEIQSMEQGQITTEMELRLLELEMKSDV